MSIFESTNAFDGESFGDMIFAKCDGGGWNGVYIMVAISSSASQRIFHRCISLRLVLIQPKTTSKKRGYPRTSLVILGSTAR